MNEQVKKEWLKALRSGEYTQGRGQLRATTLDDETLRYCCLGVLCDISKQGKWIGSTYDCTETRGSEVADADELVLPKTVMEWAGLFDTQGTREGDSEPLTDVNDHGASFSEIADIIEEEF